MAKLKTLYNSILIIPEKKGEQQTPSGLVVLDPDKHSSTITGEVAVIGTGYRTENGIVPLEVKVGERVVVPKNTGFIINVDGVEYLSVPEDVILAIILD